LSLEQLDSALQINPWLNGYLVTALMRSMAIRSKRTAQLKVELEDLNDKLRAERDQLAEALHQLQRAQTQLVESEKMATLGQLTAGVAHELNNPVAAIQRSADFIADDIVSLAGELPDGASIRAALETALTSAPVSTRELRRQRAALTAAVGDEALARRLLKLGIATPEAYRERFAASSSEERDRLLRLGERYCDLGTALRDLCACSDRISGIVQGLRSYARSDQGLAGDVDLHQGLEGTLRLMGHALRTIEVERSYAELPRIECQEGEINQLWTNLVSNAVQAMGETGTLRVETDLPGPGQVRVRISDSGTGIAPETLDRIFDPQFTTKDGRVEFGLGMGLPICRLIAAKHGGTIAVESKSGETCFSVVLPIRHPRALQRGADS
jgi:signal transduction histidine kinase